MFKQVSISLALAGSLLVLFGSATFSQDASERRIRKSQAAEKSKRSRAKAAQRTVRPQTSGLPPCRGALWVDSFCQLDDGRKCYVDENILIDCR